jgi:hypothetical protein
MVILFQADGPDARDGTPAAPASHGAPADSVAGYRLVRKLGSGSRADVYLAMGDAAEPHEPVALKLFHASTSAASIASEVDALARLSSAHCVRLLDYATDDDGRTVFVLTRAARGSVARLLALRGQIAVGEAVTILAPIAGAVVEMQAAGVVHSRLSAASVHFGDRGEPLLLGFGYSHLVDSSLDRLGATADSDRERLATFATFVLAAVTQSRHTSASAELLDWIETQPPPLPAGFASDLQSRLFDLAPACAVSFEALARAHQSAVARGEDVSRSALVAPTGAKTAQRAAKHSGWVDVALGASPFAPLIARTRNALLTRLPSALRVVRPRFWVVAAVLVAAVAAAVVVLPHKRPGPEETPRDEQPAAAVTGAPASAGATEGPALAEPFDPGALPDDPVVAVPLLLAERAQCYADLSVLCLDGVNQTTSALSAEDTANIVQPDKLAGAGDTASDTTTPEVAGRALEEPFVVADTGLVERLGDAAIVQFTTNGKPASVLMIRTEAGWRLRELYGVTEVP